MIISDKVNNFLNRIEDINTVIIVMNTRNKLDESVYHGKLEDFDFENICISNETVGIIWISVKNIESICLSKGGN